MKDLLNTKTNLPQPVLKIEDRADLANLESRAGVLGRFGAGMKTKSAAADALADIRVAQVRAQRDVALAAITTAKASLQAAIVAEAQPALGTLIARLNSATSCVRATLTTGAAIETQAHFANRAENLAMFRTLLAEGKMTAEEAEAITAQIDADTYADIAATKDREGKAKATIECIYSHGLARIERAKGDDV